MCENIVIGNRNTYVVYERIAKEYDKLTSEFRDEYLINDLNLFMNSMSGKTILDVGSGSGRDSKYFLENGFKPLCLDFSQAMIDMCKLKGLEGVVCDFEKMTFKEKSFAGIWAYTSLLHISKKNISLVLENIYKILENNGIFYIGMKEGEGEYVKKTSKYGKDGRHFSLYYLDELSDLLSLVGFQIINKSKITHSNGNIYINLMCKK